MKESSDSEPHPNAFDGESLSELRSITEQLYELYPAQMGDNIVIGNYLRTRQEEIWPLQLIGITTLQESSNQEIVAMAAQSLENDQLEVSTVEDPDDSPRFVYSLAHKIGLWLIVRDVVQTIPSDTKILISIPGGERKDFSIRWASKEELDVSPELVTLLESFGIKTTLLRTRRFLAKK